MRDITYYDTEGQQHTLNILCMNTGLMDRNNKHIYDGDTLEYYDSEGEPDTGTVVYRDGCYRLDEVEDELYYYANECLVISSVYCV